MRLKELRQEKDLTQYEIAKGINTSQRNISRWENGDNEPSSTFIIKLANFFDVSTDYLLGLEDDFGVRTAAPIGDAYSSEEQRLISVYRSLSPDLRQTLWNLLATWTPTETFKAPQKKRS